MVLTIFLRSRFFPSGGALQNNRSACFCQAINREMPVDHIVKVEFSFSILAVDIRGTMATISFEKKGE
jgi:hypothetical protein